MTESDKHDWQQIEHIQDEKGFKLSIEHSSLERQFRVVVSHEQYPEKSLSEQFNATYEPIFGIDIADQQVAYEIAEELAQKLESKLQL
jgi:hypothetical protein